MASSAFVDISGKCFCVVTGASQGIGRALAVEASQVAGPGSLFLLVARNSQALAETQSLCNATNVTFLTKVVDLAAASVEDMQKILKEALEGRNIDDFDLNIIFHNVGSIGDMSTKTTELDNVQHWRDYYDLNVFNVVTLNSQFLKLMEGREERAVVVNVTSLCALKPMTGLAQYCSGKAAREMYFRVLAEELPSLRVLNYSPGPVETAMVDSVIQDTVNDNLRDVFTSFRKQNVLLKPEMTAKKCLTVLAEGNFKSGDHIDYFD